MASASYAQTSFLGGERSKAAQGRFDLPDYRTSMNLCLNSFPVETGAWTRRSGTRHLATTRNGSPGRVVSFDFTQSSPYEIEFTDGFIRFFDGPDIVMTNDEQVVSSTTNNDPVQVVTASAHGWTTLDQVFFKDVTVLVPRTEPILSRFFTITVNNSTTFQLADANTGDDIDGALFDDFTTINVARVLQIVSPYTGGKWADVRVVQADLPARSAGADVGALLLHAEIKPYLLSVTSFPTEDEFAEFDLDPAVFKDGPYFDPVPGGTLATPSALIGNINITLSFNAWSGTTSYSIGDYVTEAGVNYKSLTDANLNHAPPNGTHWVTTTAADAIGPNGFVGTDVGRMIRLFSEPPLWVSGASYTIGTSVVAYGGTYYKALSSHTAGATNTPSTSPTVWGLYPQGAIWSWGRITALSNIINRALAGSASIGDMTGNGGLAAAVDGVLDQILTACATLLTTESSKAILPGATVATVSSYVGKNYAAASDQKVQQTVIYPSGDQGFATGGFVHSLGTSVFSFDGTNGSITLNLRGKATLPASASDGTLLGTSGAIANTTAPVTIVSTDQTTSWKYVWVELIATGKNYSSQIVSSYFLTTAISELVLYNPAGTGTSAGVTVQLIGDPLLYTSAVRVWRLGLYSDTTGWPRCGTYHEGRLWLSGAVPNRIDSSKSNDVFNMAPTESSGTVTAANGISYVFNSKDTNPIFWMESDDLGIVAGTQAGEWLVQATTLNQPLSPTNIQAHRVTKSGCANIEPRRTDLTLAVVQRYGRKLLEYFSEVYRGKFTAQNLSLYSKHINVSGIQEIAYQQELSPIVWQRLGNGTFSGVSYKRDSLLSSQPPTFMGAHRHTLGSGRTVESICTGANEDGTLDALTMVTNDATTSIRHVEMLMTTFEEGGDLTDAWFLDDAIIPPYTVLGDGIFTIYGLWPHEGKTVTVFAGGLDLGEFEVELGAVEVTLGSGTGGTAASLFTASFISDYEGTMPIVVGFTFQSDGQIVRPATPPESGARNGPALGKKRRNHQFAALLENCVTGSVSFGTTFDNLAPVQRRSGGGTPLSVLTLFTGVHWDSIKDEDTYDGMICWRIERPYPLTIAALEGYIDTKDK